MINVHASRNSILVVTGLLTGVATDFCGHIAFLGLAVHHVARMLLHTADHRYLMPGTMLLGAAMALFCNILCILPGSSGVIPLNVVTPLLGAPVIIYVLFNRKIR